MKYLKPLLLLSLCAIISCSSKNRLAEFGTTTNCIATIEGEVFEHVKWYGEAPLLVTRSVGRNFDYRKGEIVELTEEGVIFNEQRSSIAYNPEPREFKKNQIVSLINEDGEIILGEFPEEDHATRYYQFQIQKDQENIKPKHFRVYPGQSFAYCVDPGEYIVENLVWVRNGGDKDISSEEFQRNIKIEEGAAHYIGLFTLNSSDEIENSQRIRIPLKILDRPKRTGGWIVAFGAVGGVIDAVSRDRGIIGFLDIDITHSEHYESLAGFPVKYTELKELE